MSEQPNNPDVIVVGGGHAGVEAAWACANLGASVALVTLDPSKIGVMSCNPAIGGLAKGQMVREIDAMGGLMGIVADDTGIMFKTLNMSRGPAVRSPRAQCDNIAYAKRVQQLVATRPEITVVAGAVDDLLTETDPITRRPRIIGAVITAPDGKSSECRARAVVLTTGTFMRGLMHKGNEQTVGGRVGEGAAVPISAALKRMGFVLQRLKTGTPPRLDRGSIDWQSLEPQPGETPPRPFSDLTDPSRFPALEQLECRITATTPDAHKIILANLDRAPLFTGQIDAPGPRYCPSIEDKVVRFAQRKAHHVFLEPESHESARVYCNGISTSLPEDVQLQIIRTMRGCARAEVLQYGYAVEYDAVCPHQIRASCQTKLVDGFFLAGQINATSGYEEAAAQGLLAGLNATRFVRSEPQITLARDQAYIAVMMDDLVTKTPKEPYRMFTSRAEHRLVLRADNTADRLTPLARDLGLVCDKRWGRYTDRASKLEAFNAIVASTKAGNTPLAHAVKRPRYTPDDLAKDLGFDAVERFTRPVVETVLAERQYEGYIIRQRAEIKRHAKMERRRIPTSFDFELIPGLRAEACQALSHFKPDTLGQATRLEGVNPSDVSLLVVALERATRRP